MAVVSGTNNMRAIRKNVPTPLHTYGDWNVFKRMELFTTNRVMRTNVQRWRDIALSEGVSFRTANNAMKKLYKIAAGEIKVRKFGKREGALDALSDIIKNSPEKRRDAAFTCLTKLADESLPPGSPLHRRALALIEDLGEGRKEEARTAEKKPKVEEPEVNIEEIFDLLAKKTGILADRIVLIANVDLGKEIDFKVGGDRDLSVQKTIGGTVGGSSREDYGYKVTIRKIQEGNDGEEVIIANVLLNVGTPLPLYASGEKDKTPGTTHVTKEDAINEASEKGTGAYELKITRLS